MSTNIFNNNTFLDFSKNQGSKIEDVEVALSVIDKNDVFKPMLSAEEIINDLITSPIRKAGNKRVKRPLNKFMVFKKSLKKLIEASNNIPRKHRMRQITHVASKFWNSASDEQKKPFEIIAKDVKSLHKTMFPEYEYAPTKPLQDPFINLTGRSTHIGPVLLESVEDSEDSKQPVEEQKTLDVSQESNLINSYYLFEGQHFVEKCVSSNGNEIAKENEDVMPQLLYDPTNVIYPQLNNEAIINYRYADSTNAYRAI
ncbi:2933_t:CDS:2 [Dentiscutata erythropus]|uniref:2933_t:CDS:1 n=1 Tax=Dentiscutata erythropus TaxID=1348616 RepID=A0A9N8W736_9GLOM|nr:2933_t:CDS:2 [Dentiscutata erythropus]